jgi:hypothetical protein
MLSPIKTPEGAPLDCDYVCPAAMCTNWQEQKKQKNSLRFQPCPKKFAAMCHNNSAKAHTAFQDYEQVGSGQYRNPQDRSNFRREVLTYCDAPTGPAEYPSRGTRTGGTGAQVEQCHSSSVWYVAEYNNLEDNPPLRTIGRDEDGNKIQVMEFVSNNGNAVPAAGSLGYSALHLLLATSIEQASEEEIQAIKRRDLSKLITRKPDDIYTLEEGGKGCRVKFKMSYGKEFIIPYPEVCGRILADTGSTTTLINREFAERNGLQNRKTGADIILRDVNNGVSTLADHCIFRLTLTTVKGEQITIIILAHCVTDLSHDLLLGTRDMERYKLSVMAHRGEAQMQIGDTIEILPMLDGGQISHLQTLMTEEQLRC